MSAHTEYRKSCLNRQNCKVLPVKLHNAIVKLPLLILVSTVGLGVQPTASAQKFIQLERAGRIKTTRFYPGAVLVYRYEDTWYSGEIQDVLYDVNMVVFHNRILPLKDIEALRLPKRTNKKLGARMLGVGMIWTMGHLLYESNDNQPGVQLTPFQIGAGAVTMTAGSIILLDGLRKYKVIEMNKRKRLRIIDLTP